MRVFLDTNILLDVLMNRPGLVADTEAVILNCAAAGHPMFIACHRLATAYYLIRRGRTKAEAMTKTVLPSGLKKNAIFRHVLRNTYPHNTNRGRRPNAPAETLPRPPYQQARATSLIHIPPLCVCSAPKAKLKVRQ